MNPHSFEPFQHIRRMSRGCVVTEKIDGTNAQIFIPDDLRHVYAGSRNRWITPDDDNYGFAKWVHEHAQELLALGPGRHFGEWWGHGIQRGYGAKDKRFWLFNSGRWSNPESGRPECCGVVPVLYAGEFVTNMIDGVLTSLELTGSIAAPGFMNPEGIVIYHAATGQLFKKTTNGDGHKTAKEQD